MSAPQRHVRQVLQDKRFKNRELQIMRMLVKKEHPNIVRLKHCFYSNGDKVGEASQVYPESLRWHA